MFKQVIGTIFSLIEETHDKWKSIKGSEALPTFGFQARVIPEEIPQDFNDLFKHFQKGVEKRAFIWKEILKTENYKALEKLTSQPKKGYSFPLELWVKIIYDYIIFYHRFKNVFMEMSLPSVLESMIPLYFGFTSSFVLKTKTMSNQEAEEEIENICLEYERLKPYLVENWDKRD
jgi:hypothetical protein